MTVLQFFYIEKEFKFSLNSFKNSPRIGGSMRSVNNQASQIAPLNLTTMKEFSCNIYYVYTSLTYIPITDKFIFDIHCNVKKLIIVCRFIAMRKVSSNLLETHTKPRGPNFPLSLSDQKLRLRKIVHPLHVSHKQECQIKY